MTRRSLLTMPVALLGVLVLAAATPSLKGPPWISIEYPANPHDATTRGAYLLVHAFHHGTPVSFPLEGRAEGLVAGRRHTATLEFSPTSRAGVYALRKTWPADGAWVLVIRLNQGSEGAQALVEIGTSGDIAAVRVPTRQQGGWTIPQPVTQEMVETALRTRAALAARE